MKTIDLSGKNLIFELTQKRYNFQNSRERLSNLRDEQQIVEDDKEFERLRRQINVNTKNKVTEILDTAKEGDHKIFDKLIDEIEDKALEQQKKFQQMELPIPQNTWLLDV